MPAPGLKIDWPVLMDWASSIQAIIQAGHLDVFTSYGETASVVAQHSLLLYQGYLKGMPLPNGASVQHPSGNLARHAELDEAGFLDFRLKNDESYAEAIEKGTKERDLKQMLATAPKARRAKDGHLYLIIPFRHGTPGTVGLRAMPARVAQMAQALSRSKRTGTYMEPSVTRKGEQVERYRYRWGGRLTGKQLADAGLGFQVQRRYQGLVKFGEAGHSSYMTFRVLSEKSKGWVLPARPGLWPARTAAEVAYTDGKGALESALLEDLMRLAGL